MTTRINLLPHREMRRERRKKDFVGVAVLTAIAAGAVVFFGGIYNGNQVSNQLARNDFIQKKNEELDKQIQEIASLRNDIEALKARQKAVEDLQSDRTVPVHLLDELVKYTPEGIFIKSIKQEEKKLTLVGLAQSNERVSEFLRNLQSNTPWMEKPELIEIKSATLGAANNGRDGKRVFEFQLSTLIKSSPVIDPAAAKAASIAVPGTTTTVATSATAVAVPVKQNAPAAPAATKN